MHADRQLTEGRFRRFEPLVAEPALYRERLPLTVSAWAVPGESVPFAEAVAAPYVDHARHRLGSAVGNDLVAHHRNGAAGMGGGAER